VTTLPSGYPVAIEVDDPQPQNRLSVLLRIFFVIPAAIVVWFVQVAAAIVWIVSWFAIAATGKYPEGMLRFSIGAMRWATRFSGYALLLTDRYPPFSLEDDAAYPIRYSAEGQVDNRNRLTTFWPVRMLMLIPHFVVVYFINLAAAVVVLIAWFAALFTGSVPPGLHRFLAGFLRWSTRVNSYQLNLIDQYPPFSLD